MKTSCITHPAGDPLLLLRRWHVLRYPEHHCAALCLGVFELERRGLGYAPLPQYVSSQVIQQRLLGCYSHKVCLDGLLTLAHDGLLQSYKISQNEARQICQAKHPQSIEGAVVSCAWCGGRTWTLQQHHFPRTLAEGGETTVDICGSCHDEYHWLIGSILFRALPQLDALIDAHPLTAEEAARLE